MQFSQKPRGVFVFGGYVSKLSKGGLGLIKRESSWRGLRVSKEIRSAFKSTDEEGFF